MYASHTPLVMILWYRNTGGTTYTGERKMGRKEDREMLASSANVDTQRHLDTQTAITSRMYYVHYPPS